MRRTGLDRKGSYYGIFDSKQVEIAIQLHLSETPLAATIEGEDIRAVVSKQMALCKQPMLDFIPTTHAWLRWIWSLVSHARIIRRNRVHCHKEIGRQPGMKRHDRKADLEIEMMLSGFISIVCDERDASTRLTRIFSIDTAEETQS